MMYLEISACVLLAFVSGYNLALCHFSKQQQQVIDALKDVAKSQEAIDDIIERNSL